MLDRLVFEHLFRYEAARASSEERALVFAVVELPYLTAREGLLADCATLVAGTLGPHDIIGHWGAGLVVLFRDSNLEQARSVLDRAFMLVRDATGVALAGVVRVVLEETASHTARVAISELA